MAGAARSPAKECGMTKKKKSLENCDPNAAAIAARPRISPIPAVLQESNRLESCCQARAPEFQESLCSSTPPAEDSSGGIPGDAEVSGSSIDKDSHQEGETEAEFRALGRRICGSKVQSLVQAFESMISLAEVNTHIRKMEERREWQPSRRSLSQTEEEFEFGSCEATQEKSAEEDNADSEGGSLDRDEKDDIQSEKNASDCGSSESYQKSSKATCIQPFSLRTQARGARKEYEFRKKLQKIFEEDSKLRIPIAQGLPWTTDEPEVVPKPPPKENTVPMDIRLCTEFRSVRRAQFDDYIAAKIIYIEHQREEQQRLQELAEQEEIKQLRKEMVPRAQLMPYFDRPFIPQRSSKRLTVPKEPNFHCSHDHKRAKCCIVSQ
ncbi:uncharacterized protein LOC112346549 [Selaginella moellendorffii]|uniref:uncharacterized protein LOC112346549 n=1 Tax=Selaginella moellendorffii TaxID=88036 RepID=UPI000D1D0DB5|nr:uncharacterized protein LOC112346549 [Selaginella moellendorffii]|eukprot:XP_024531549.1 uncharacterized protein LOC112346549 [Selaginella moellendorffii]